MDPLTLEETHYNNPQEGFLDVSITGVIADEKRLVAVSKSGIIYTLDIKGKWRFFSPGATLATLGTITSSLAFSYFVNNFGRFNKFYGSVGTVIVFMLWVYINSTLLLIGYELNHKIFSYIDEKKNNIAKDE